MLIGIRDRLPNLFGLFQIFIAIRPQQSERAFESRVGGVYIVQSRDLRLIAKLLIASDIEQSMQLVALVPIENAQWEIDAKADIGTQRERLMRNICAKGRIS